MEQILAPGTIQDLIQQLWSWLQANVLNIGSAAQIGVIIAALGLAALAAPRARALIERVAGWDRLGGRVTRRVENLRAVALPLLWLIVIWAYSIVAAELAWPYAVASIAVNLIAAWLVIRLLTLVIRDSAISKMVGTCVWVVAALNILDLLDPTIAALDGLSFTVGSLRISALTVVKGMIALAVLLWAATILSQLVERRIHQMPSLTPSLQVLLVKLLKIVLLTLAVVAAISTVGIDLTAFAVFGGAVGVGVGLGLQRGISNLVSGLMILMDRSIKPGDVIEVGGTYGWVNSLGGRYASIVTRDSIEHLIPNDELISQRVANWSYSSNELRLKIDVGISYKSDPRKAIELCLEAARETDRVLADPQPICLLTGFGDSSVDLEIRFWINDPRNGTSNVRSDILLKVWDKFHANGIEIPFPQRDLHLKSADTVRVVSDSATAAD